MFGKAALGVCGWCERCTFKASCAALVAVGTICLAVGIVQKLRSFVTPTEYIDRCVCVCVCVCVCECVGEEGSGQPRWMVYVCTVWAES